MNRYLAVTLVWLCSVALGTAQEGWRITSQEVRLELAHHAYQTTKKITHSASAKDAKLKLVFFDAKHCTLQILDQPFVASAKTLGEVMAAKGNAIAACNAGYFTPSFDPLGLVISNGTKAGAFQRSSLLGGLVQVQNGRPMLLWRDEFTSSNNITELVQAGPRLTNGGRAIKGLEAARSRPRTFIFTDNNGRWGMGSSSSLTLRELSDVLSTTGIITELEIDRALNLDGGSSSALWWRSSAGEVSYDREFTTVRNFIVIVPRL